MKRISFLFALIFTGCYSTSIVNNNDIHDVNFNNIKKGTVAVFAGGMGATFNKESGIQILDDKNRSQIVNLVNNYFESYIPSIKIINDLTPLPRSYMGELNMNQEQEMNQFLEKVTAEYAYIVSGVLQDLNTKNKPMISYNKYGMVMTTSVPEVDNKININFELWDVRNKVLLLDYEVTCKGWIDLDGTLEEAIVYIQQNGD